jgi:hypothetical protein
MAPLLLSVLTVAALLVGVGRALTILHVIGMLLIVAVGSNYALFFDRAARQPREGSVPLILASLLSANLATVIAFGVLGFSSVPVLADLGSTVAPGTLLALIFAAMLASSLRSLGKHHSHDPDHPRACAHGPHRTDPRGHVAGRLYRPADFMHHGFARAVRERSLDVDLVFAGFNLEEVIDRSVYARLREEIILPARALGCALWIGGIPSVVISRSAAPSAIRASSRVSACWRRIWEATWSPARSRVRAASRVGDPKRPARRMRSAASGASSGRCAPVAAVHLGLGREDRFGRRQELLAAALSPANVDTVSGGHDWMTWRTFGTAFWR